MPERTQKRQVKITVYELEDGTPYVEVDGFPSNHDAAMQLMWEGLRLVSKQFCLSGVAGNLDDNLTITDSKVLVPKNSEAILSQMSRKDFSKVPS